MFAHDAPSELHRCHCRENDVGVGDQLPFETRSVSPTTGEPLTAGRTVLAGPFVPAITSLAAEVAGVLPSTFTAVTTTRKVWPTSPATGEYVLLVAPLMSPHALPSDVQRCH
jgi:hypothetical protein